MKTYKEEVIENLVTFVRALVVENFQMHFSSSGIKMIQRIKSNKVKIPVGADHIAITKELIDEELNSFPNHKLGSDVRLLLMEEKDEIIHCTVMQSWNELAEKSKI